MLAGLIIWSTVTVLIIGIGIWSWNSRKPAGFYAGTEPPRVRDVKKYNRAVGILWFAYAALFELLGFPFLLEKQNGPLFLVTILGTVLITIGLMVAYNRILGRYRAPKDPSEPDSLRDGS